MQSVRTSASDNTVDGVVRIPNCAARRMKSKFTCSTLYEATLADDKCVRVCRRGELERFGASFVEKYAKTKGVVENKLSARCVCHI